MSFPTSFTLTVNDGGVAFELDLALSGDLNLGIALQPITIEPLTINPLAVTLALEPIEIKPIDLSLRIKEIPSVRVQLPLDYCIGVALLGFELLSVRLCGQGQVITEPYVPNPCECGYQRIALGGLLQDNPPSALSKNPA